MNRVPFLRSVGICVPCLLFASFSDASNDPVTARPLSTAKMSDCDGLACVDLKMQDGKHLTLAVDTGNPTSILSLKTAAALGLKLTPYENSSGTVVPGVQTALLAGATLGSGALGDLKFGVIDLSESINNGTFPPVDGTIAYGAFKQRLLQLDYSTRTLRYSAVSTSAQKCPVENCGKLSFVTFGHAGPPIVVSTGFSVNGKSITVQVDTMYAGTMLIFPPQIDRLGLKSQSESAVTRHFAFTDEGVDMTEAGPASEAFGNQILLRAAHIYFAGPKVHLPDGMFDGTVGTELFAGHQLNLDFSGMNMWIG